MPILEQIPEPELGKPGWNPRFKQVLDRANAIPEIALDALAQKMVAGSGIAINYNSATKVLTISGTGSGGLDTEAMMDYLAANLVPGTDLGLTYDDTAGTLTLNYTGTGGAGGSTDPEVVRDTIATALVVAGSLQKTVDDAGDTITVSNAPRVVAIADAATITPNSATTDIFKTTLGGNRNIAAPSGVPVSGQKLIGRLKQDGTGSRAPVWDAIYRFPGGSPPVLTTTPNKTDYLGFIYNGDDVKWDNVAITKNI